MKHNSGSEALYGNDMNIFIFIAFDIRIIAFFNLKKHLLENIFETFLYQEFYSQKTFV